MGGSVRSRVTTAAPSGGAPSPPKAAESVGDKAVLADALRVMDWAAMDLGELDRPDNLERALALFEELGDLPGQAGVLNMLGGFAYYKGDWEQASALYLRAQATVRRTGNAVMDAFYVFNLGEIARDQGRLDEAERALTSALRTWRAAGYRSGTGYAKGMLARVATGQHRYGDALRLFEEAIEELSDIGSRGEVLEVQAGLAEYLLLSGDTAGALSLADETISQAHALGGMAPQIPALYRVRGAALALAGDGDGARQSLRQSLQAAEMREVEYEAARTMRVLAAVETDPREQELPGSLGGTRYSQSSRWSGPRISCRHRPARPEKRPTRPRRRPNPFVRGRPGDMAVDPLDPAGYPQPHDGAVISEVRRHRSERSPGGEAECGRWCRPEQSERFTSWRSSCSTPSWSAQTTRPPPDRPSLLRRTSRKLIGGTLHIVTAYQRKSVRIQDLPEEFRHTATLNPADALLHELSLIAKERGLESVIHPALGQPAEAVIRVAEAEKADLIVVGNKGMAGTRRVLGSVPNSIAHGAPCSVLLVDTHEAG